MRKVSAIEKIKAYEQKERMYNKAKGRCYVCGKRLAFTECQLAHRFHRGYIDIYGRDVMFHEFMMEITCPDCNSKVLLSPAAHPVEAADLLHRIYDDLRSKENG